MPNIQINIKDKVARADRVIIVCDNSDYTAVFDFDDEWSAYETKTARFVYGGTYTDVVFTGNSCPIPEIHDSRSLSVGVYAGDLHTTTPAYISCVPSILCGNGIPADPTPEVYAQIMELLNKESGIWYPAVDDAGNMSWTRSMSETEPQPVNIKGPKGDAGADGVGIPGTDGKDGADGKSAYELAQDNGFVGTMQEWLASLVGADGKDGNDGVSPAVSVAAITGGNRVTITDAEGAKTFDVMDGAQGASGADGKDYVLTDTDKQEIAKTAAGLVDVPSVQPDWNQNDSTQPDYIKNRPFYVGNPVETVLVEESTVSFSNAGGIYWAQFSSTFAPTVGETYKVYWDGTAYECTCVDFNGYHAIGNLSIAGAGSDTGEPFLVSINNDGGLEIYTADTSASHTISISAFDQEVVKIDLKYLPMSTDDSYGVIKKSDIVSSYNFPMHAPHDRMLDAINAFNTGNASIVWDGEKVIMARYDSSNDTISVVFAEEPLRLLTYSNNGGIYKKTLGSDTYGELQGNQIRITNNNNVYAVLTVEGESSNASLTVSAERISIGGSYYGVSKTEMILGSSTAGSTKNFKITVDDSGAITATEVS